MRKIFIKVRVVIFVIYALSLIFCGLSAAGEPKSCLITAYDAYIPSEAKSIKIRAKLESVGVLNINPDVEGERLTFYIDSERIGAAATDSNGFAELEFKPGKRVNSALTVKLEGSDDYIAKDDISLIYAIDPKKPTIISDIDWTVSETDKSALILKDVDDESVPLKDAPSVLNELHAHYNIVFVTGREDALLHKTRAWLKRWEFPDLPVFYADFGQTPYFFQDDYKKEAVALIKSEIKNVTIGIGDMDHDAKAYLNSALKAIIIRADGDVPKGAVKVPDWQSIKEMLLKVD